MTRFPILCVDDEPMVLEGLEANLERHFDVSTATSGAEGLRILALRPHAVVISDMRMPNMNGAKFLGMVRALYPDTVRIMLTGQSDIEAAAEAINNGNLFRMLLKPCPTESVLGTIRDAVRQHELLIAERTLLEQTLNGAVAVLADILGLLHPLAFGHATRISSIVKHVVGALAIPDGWQIELAAMVSQIGCVTLAPHLIERAYAGSLTAEETASYRKHPQHAQKLIERIPRLTPVAAIVAEQYGCTGKHETATTQLGCQILRCAIAIDHELSRSKIRFDEATSRILAHGTWDPRLEPVLRTYHANLERRMVQVQGMELRADMLLEVDAVSPKGELWMTKGNLLTYVSAKRLRSLAERGMLAQPLLVGLPL